MKNIRIVIFFFIVLIATFVSLAGRCLYLQYFKSDFYTELSARQQLGRIIQKPQRGVILDCRGRVLAASNKIQTIFAEPRIIKDPLALSAQLAPITDLPPERILKIITESKNPGFAKIKTAADPNQCNAARKLYGIGIESDWKRYYPAETLAAHVVGFTSSDNRGLSGIELQCDNQLTGSLGQNIFLADAFRRPVQPKLPEKNLRDGTGVILTLDATIQQFARTELLEQYRQFQAESAVAIVADAKTAAILAMVSLPDFDPTDISSAPSENLRNRAIIDQFEPGSIIKPIAAAIALDAGVIATDEKIFCENGNYRGKGFGRIGEYRDRQYGDLAIREILVKSSNVGMAKIGQRLGKDRLYKGLTLFGFGRKTKIELDGEATGLLRPPEQWTGYSLTRIPFGHEISTTAIQLVRSFCILANGGRVVHPFLIKAMVDNNGNVIKIKRSTPSVGFVISPEVARWITTDALVGVVNEGTGRRARLKKWQVFGKTGSANIAEHDKKGYSENDYVASFIGGAPADDPVVIVLVSIRKPDRKLGKGYTGGTVAAPVAAKIIERTLTYLGLPEREN